MMDVRFVPMAKPDRLAYASSGFKRTGGFWSRIMRLLDFELVKLKATEVTIHAGFKQSDIRLDGWPRGLARPDHPAVSLQFRSGVKPEVLVFSCSKYGMYEENLYAIAKTLEALRAVDRWGVVEGQQYTGFKQIAAAPPPADDGTERKIAAVRNLAENGTTEGERAAAREVLERLERGRA